MAFLKFCQEETKFDKHELSHAVSVGHWLKSLNKTHLCTPVVLAINLWDLLLPYGVFRVETCIIKAEELRLPVPYKYMSTKGTLWSHSAHSYCHYPKCLGFDSLHRTKSDFLTVLSDTFCITSKNISTAQGCMKVMLKLNLM